MATLDLGTEALLVVLGVGGSLGVSIAIDTSRSTDAGCSARLFRAGLKRCNVSARGRRT
jgi:hypothetical protein